MRTAERPAPPLLAPNLLPVGQFMSRRGNIKMRVLHIGLGIAAAAVALLPASAAIAKSRLASDPGAYSYSSKGYGSTQWSKTPLASSSSSGGASTSGGYSSTGGTSTGGPSSAPAGTSGGSPAPVPEPASITILGSGLALLAVRRRRRRA